MTLSQFFDYIGQNPNMVLCYFLGIPFAALLAGIFGKGEGNDTPWKQFYSTLSYASCVPGIFSVALSVYYFLFERGRLGDANVYTQILPVVSMFATLTLISRNATFSQIPGFGRLSSLMMMIGSIIVLMWLLDRTHIIAFTYIPIHVLLGIVIALLVIFRYGMGQMFKK